MAGEALLCQTQLRQIEQELRSIKAPVARHFRPPLDDATIRELFSHAGLESPGELRAWWGWHDGVVWTRGRAMPREISLHRGLMPSLARSLRYRHLLLHGTKAYPRPSRARHEWYWRPEWIPLTMGSAAHWVAECVPGSERTRILRMDTFTLGLTGDMPELAPSLSDLLEVWLEGLRSRAVVYDAQSGWCLADSLDPRDAVRLDDRL